MIKLNDKTKLGLLVVSIFSGALLLAPQGASASSRSGHHRNGCFVTTSAAGHARGIRHWRSPCPHHDPHHLNPYQSKRKHHHHTR